MKTHGFFTTQIIVALCGAALIIALGLALKSSWETNAVLEESNRGLVESVEKAKAEKQRLESALVKRDEENRQAQAALSAWRKRIITLETQNAELKTWRSQPLPAAVINLLRELTGAGTERLPKLPEPGADGRDAAAAVQR